MVTDFLQTDWEELQRARDEMPYDFKGLDPIALSCAYYRTKHRDEGLGSSRLEDFVDRVSPEDKDTAANIRKYYKDKYFVKQLTSGNTAPLTAFQEKLYRFLDNGVVKYKDVGLIYRLPYWYSEDKAREIIITKTSVPTINGRVEHVTTPKIITPLLQIHISRKLNSRHEYWYTTDNNYTVCLVTMEGTIRNIIQHFHDTKHPFTMGGNFLPYRLNYVNTEFYFWNVSMPTILAL